MIKVKHLSKKFGNLEVLKDINLDINEGEVVCIIGPSGSGKSTFLRCLNRMNDLIDCVKINGKIYMDDEEILTTNDVISLRTVRKSEWFSRNSICFRLRPLFRML